MTADRRAPQNRSLARGLEILRAFRPGSDLIGNGELADRTGIAPATVSRLTQTLVSAGFLEHDPRERAYRLAAPVLSLALGMRLGNPRLQAAVPLMRAASERLGVNVGLATADRDEMVYLESIRYNPTIELRTIVSGQRVPMELTSLGRAWLAAAPPGCLDALLARLQARGSARSRSLAPQIRDAVASVRRHGYCAASWQPQVVALAAPLDHAGPIILVVNMSVSTDEAMTTVVERLSADLLKLRDAIAQAVAQGA